MHVFLTSAYILKTQLAIFYAAVNSAPKTKEMKGTSLLNRLAIILGVVQTTCALGYNGQQQQILGAAANVKDNRPNIIFILVDDQDLLLDSINYMPNLNKHVAQEGTFYRNHFVTTALCCPSRVSLLTGRLAHNTNVTDVNPPYGR